MRPESGRPSVDLLGVDPPRRRGRRRV